MGDTRRQMIDGTIDLLASGGLAQTSFATVLQRTGAPRGSIYHHFPEGKEQLVAEAVAASGARSIAMIDAWRGEPPVEVARRFLGAWRLLLTETGFRVGCAVAAVTTATDSAELLEGTAAVFSAWRTALASLLAEGGVQEARAGALAGLLIASAEGAVVISRAEQRIEPFDDMTVEVLAHLAAVTGA